MNNLVENYIVPDDGRKPLSIDLDSTSLSDEWKPCEQHGKLWFLGPLSGTTEEGKCAYLLIWAGGKWRQIFNIFLLTAEETNYIDSYLRKFREYVALVINSVFARYVFQNVTNLKEKVWKIHDRAENICKSLQAYYC